MTCVGNDVTRYFLLFGLDLGAGVGGAAERLTINIWGKCSISEDVFSEGISGADSSLRTGSAGSYGGSGGIDEGVSIVGYGVGFGTPTVIVYNDYQRWQ